MSGRHLRRGRGPSRRGLLAVLAVLLAGGAMGAGGSILFEDRAEDVRSVGSEGETGGAALAPAPGPITIALAGDVTAGRVLGDRLASAPDDVLGPLAEVLQGADLAVVNVDAPVVDDPTANPDVPAAPTSLLGALRAVGVDVVSAANDRSLDLGIDGLAQTLAADPDRQTLVGVGPDEAAAYRPFVRVVGGHRVAVIAATQLLDPERIASDTAGPTQPGVASAKRVDRLVAEVRSARAAADTVVVYLHWGAVGETCPTPSQQELAAALVAAGADVIAGPGSGRVEGAGRSGDAAVGYGLGTLLGHAPDDPDTGVLLVRIDGREVLGVEWVPARLAEDGVPSPLTGDEAAAARARWEERRSCTDLTP